MRTQLVTIPTDSLPLEGALHEPDAGKAAGAVLLFLRGDREDAHRYPVEEFQRAAGGPCQVEIVSDCDHFYSGREDPIADVVASWLAGKLGLRRA